MHIKHSTRYKHSGSPSTTWLYHRPKNISLPLSSLVVLLGKPEVPQKLRVDSLKRGIFVSSRFLDSISMSFHSLVVSGVVLRLGHRKVVCCCCTGVYLIS